jgi:hypothetical protein
VSLKPVAVAVRELALVARRRQVWYLVLVAVAEEEGTLHGLALALVARDRECELDLLLVVAQGDVDELGATVVDAQGVVAASGCAAVVFAQRRRHVEM